MDGNWLSIGLVIAFLFILLFSWFAMKYLVKRRFEHYLHSEHPNLKPMDQEERLADIEKWKAGLTLGATGTLGVFALLGWFTWDTFTGKLATTATDKAEKRVSELETKLSALIPHEKTYIMPFVFGSLDADYKGESRRFGYIDIHGRPITFASPPQVFVAVRQVNWTETDARNEQPDYGRRRGFQVECVKRDVSDCSLNISGNNTNHLISVSGFIITLGVEATTK
jgi:hypothetical protein